MTEKNAKTRKKKPRPEEVKAPRPDQPDERPYYSPLVDIYESDAELVVVADMPGVGSKDIEVSLENGVLTINGRRPVSEMKEIDRLYQEYIPGDYHRCFAVSEEVDVDKIKAEMRNGVLTLRMPKAATGCSRKIEVK